MFSGASIRHDGIVPRHYAAAGALAGSVFFSFFFSVEVQLLDERAR